MWKDRQSPQFLWAESIDSAFRHTIHLELHIFNALYDILGTIYLNLIRKSDGKCPQHDRDTVNFTYVAPDFWGKACWQNQTICVDSTNWVSEKEAGVVQTKIVWACPLRLCRPSLKILKNRCKKSNSWRYIFGSEAMRSLMHRKCGPIRVGQGVPHRPV